MEFFKLKPLKGPTTFALCFHFYNNFIHINNCKVSIEAWLDIALILNTKNFTGLPLLN